MTHSEGNLHSKTADNGNDQVQVGNGSLLSIKRIRSFHVPAVAKLLVLKSVLHVPSLKHNLLSVRQLY